MTLVAQIQTCDQTSPYDYQSVTRTLLVTERTTVAEIVAWWNRVHPQATAVGPITLLSTDEPETKQ